jgi:hypothetical protein
MPTKIGHTPANCFTAPQVVHKKAPPGGAELSAMLHVKEITLMNFLVVVKITIPTVLVDPLVVLSRLGQMLRSATSQE